LKNTITFLEKRSFLTQRCGVYGQSGSVSHGAIHDGSVV
jgi:hypothetical protein